MKNSNLEDGLDCPFEEDDIVEEEEYDALNDETFGSEATIGDWEKDHEKLAEITESTRPHHQNVLTKKNGINADIEDNLSHLVLDDKEGIVPRPGVWDSPSNLSPSKPRPPLALPSALTNVCTVEELEKGLIANRPPPGLTRPVQVQPPQQQKPDGSLLFESLSGPPRFPPGLVIPPPHPVVLPPNMRFPHPQFLQHPRLLHNQTGNVLRYPVAAHLMMPHTTQRQPIHVSLCNNFPQPPHSNICPPPFLRADHSVMMPPFASNQANHHHHHHHQQQQQQQQQQQHQQQQQQQQQHPFSHSGTQWNQNRPFYHGEQQGNHQPFFKNNQHHRNHDRNNQRHYNNYQHHHHSHGINGITNLGEYDEYAGLMSSREKQWLINIQLLQLNTNEPYVDDYYYTVFCDRRNKQSISQEQKDKKQHNSNNNNSYHRDSRDRDQSHQVLSRPRYIPTQFENSLGKLQFASVIAPRKVIDMDVVPNSDPQSATQMQQKDTKRTRQLLLEIERLYIIQLKLEDLHNPLALLSEQQQSQECDNEVNSLKKTSPDLISTMLTGFLQSIQDDKLASMLSIRKGKTLLLRFLPYLNVTDHRNQLEELWNAIFRGLAIIGRRDSQLLISLHTEFLRWFNIAHDFDTVLRLARSLSDSTGQPIKNNSLAFALTNEFGVSVIASMFEQAEKLYPVDDSLSSEWSSFIANIDEIIGQNPPCVAPCRPIAANTLNQHLNRLSPLKCGRYTALELLLTDV